MRGQDDMHRRGIGMTSQRTRERLIQRLYDEGLSNPRVLEVIRRTPRHLFVDEALAHRAYEDTALPIGNGQTISQPWVVARMTEALVEHGLPERVLEVGTGSGYQASVLATLGLETYSVERIEELLRVARRRFRHQGLNVRTRHDDGRAGWPEYAPFGGILVTAGAAAIEPALLEQLEEGGTLVAPVGGPNGQRLLRIRRLDGQLVQEDLGGVVFVPLLPGTL